VAFLEGRVNQHSRGIDGVRDALSSLDQRIDRRFDAFDRRLEMIDRRFEGVERRLDAVDEKLSRSFVWLVGVQVTTLAAIVAALVAR